MWFICAFFLTSLNAHAGDDAVAERRADLHRRMSARDVGPVCADLAALTPDPVGDFVWLMDHAKQPPWVGIRAAQCVIDHYAEPEIDRLRGWAVDADRKGLVVLLLGRLDTLPEPIAQAVGEAAMAGPHADLARTRLIESSHPSVRAMVEAASVSPDSSTAGETP